MFYVYAVFLVLSGVLMIVLAAVRTGRSAGRRVLSGIVGTGFTVYGLYLLLFFQGGTYRLFLYAFVLPILLTVQFFRERSAVKAMQAANAGRAAPAGYAQPYGQVPPAGYAQPYGQVPPAGYAQPYGQAPDGQVPPAGGPAQPPQG
jgi:hypothetical protein